MFIPDLGSNSCSIKRGKNFWGPTLFCGHKYHKIVNNFIFEQVKMIGIRDPEKPIPDPGSRVKKASDPGSGSVIL
jgi:hypothetical protein